MKTFKIILGGVFILGGLVTAVLYLFTDLIDWNFDGWLSWLLCIVGGAFFRSANNQQD